jgi:hypothetical protein
MSKKEYLEDINKKSTMTDDSIIVRLTGHGQYRVNLGIIDKIDNIDNSIVDIIESLEREEERDAKVKEKELREKITEIVNLITSEGRPIDDKEIVQSHIIIPDADISLEEAKKIFRGEGIIPDI